MSQKGTPERTIEWARRNVGAGVKKVAKWDRQAGFGTGTAWCGIFLGAAMRTQGLAPPKGYAAAVNWSRYGTRVGTNGADLSKAQPGDILVYGTNHVAMYLGNGRQIQGNNSNGTVGESGVGSSLGLGPITAIRRPPYKGGSQKSPYATLAKGLGISIAEAKKLAENEDLGEPFLGVGPDVPGGGVGGAASKAGEAVGGVAGDVLSGILGDIHPEALMLNIALLGGGAFLVYYGAALLLGVKKPVATPIKAAAVAPE